MFFDYEINLLCRLLSLMMLEDYAHMGINGPQFLKTYYLIRQQMRYDDINFVGEKLAVISTKGEPAERANMTRNRF